MRNAGMKTDRMQSKARSRGTAVMLLPSKRRRGDVRRPPHLRLVFSTVTVASSTRMPIASAMPPSDMILIVLPRQPEAEQRPQQRDRNIRHDHDHAPQVPEEKHDHQARSTPAPISPSVATLRIAATTAGDSSNSKSIVTSLGTESRNNAIDLRMSATTVNVEAVSFLMIGR